MKTKILKNYIRFNFGVIIRYNYNIINCICLSPISGWNIDINYIGFLPIIFIFKLYFIYDKINIII